MPTAARFGPPKETETVSEQTDEQQQQQASAKDQLGADDQQQPAQPDDAAALWSELEREESGGAAASDKDAAADADSSNAWPESDDAAAKRQEADQPSSDQQPDDQQRQEASQESGGEGETNQPDIWAQASPEHRAAFEAAQGEIDRLKQSDLSQRGRLGAMQRKINQLERAQQERQQQPTSTQQPSADSGGDQGDNQGAAAAGFLASNEWTAFQEEYPDVAGPLGKVITGLQERVDQQARQLEGFSSERRQDQTDRHVEEQTALLEQQHSDWLDVTSDTQRFTDWVDAQPRHIREAAIRNAEGIVDAAEAADVISRFKSHLSSLQGGGGGAPAQGQQPSGEQPGNGKNEALERRRERQLESASSARSSGPGTASGIPENGDPQQIWDALDRQEAAEQRRRA